MFNMILKYKNQIFSVLLVVVLSFIFCSDCMAEINTTSLALNYGYGFITRGFVGSIMKYIFRIDSFGGVYIFSVVSAVALAVMITRFVLYCLKKNENVAVYVYLLIIFTIPTFFSQLYLGRLDTYCFLYSLIALFLLYQGKYEWLCVPLAIIGELTHQGYVFLYFNIILGTLWFFIYRRKDKRKYYIIILILCLVSVSALFLYLEIFRGAVPLEYYNDAVAVAKSFNRDGIVHEDVLQHELLRVNLSAESSREQSCFYLSMVQIPIAIIMFLPHIILLIQNIRGLSLSFSNASWLGGLTLAPMVILKTDLGRWVCAFLIYYILLTLTYSLFEKEYKPKVPSSFILVALLLIYSLDLVPFEDVFINKITGFFVYNILM